MTPYEESLLRRAHEEAMDAKVEGIAPAATKRSILENNLCRLANADEVVISSLPYDGEFAVKFRRNSPRVNYGFMVDGADYDQALRMGTGNLMDSAKRCRALLDDLQRKEREKHSSVTSASVSSTLDDFTKALDSVREKSKKAAATTEDVAKALSSLDGAFEDAPMTITTTDTFDEVVKGISAANMICIPGLQGLQYVAEFDAIVTGALWSPTTISGETVVTFDRIVFYERIARVVVQVRDEHATTFMVAPEDMDDLFPDLSLTIDQAVAENSTFGNLAKLNEAAKTLAVGRPLMRALAEATLTSVAKAQETAVIEAEGEVTSYYERNPAYGLI